MKTDLDPLISSILDLSPRGNRSCTLVGISGIDASGKGYISAKVVTDLQHSGRNVALIGADAWLDLPDVRFDETYPPDNFYDRGLRLDEMFERLVMPLCEHGSIELEARLLEETANDFHTFHYSFQNINVVLVEGIFIFKRKYADLFDLRVWIDSSFERSLERAVERSQEGLPPEATIDAYERIYFPAQKIHFQRDDPRNSADIVIVNE